MQNRLKSKVFWVGILSAVAMLIKTVFDIDIDTEWINTGVDAVFMILAAFGVANNPTNKEGF